MDNIDKIKERVRKMLSLAANNSSEAEAMTALAMAHKLMTKYNLDQAECDPEVQEEMSQSKNPMRSSGPWARMICLGIAELYFCKYYTIKHGKRIDTHVFTGRQSNVEMVQAITGFVLGVIHNGVIRQAKVGGTPAKNSYRNHAGIRIYQRCQALIAEAKKNQEATPGTGLAVIDLYQKEQQIATEFLSRIGVNLKTSKAVCRSSDPRAAMAGYADGDKVALRSSIDRPSTRSLEHTS